MTPSRRTFLTKSAAACMLGRPVNLLHALEPDNIYRKTMGIQLYTLRHQLKKSTRATIRAVAEMGYEQVEPYSFPNCLPVLDAAAESERLTGPKYSKY